MADIFLSYARADQDRIERLAHALKEAGYSVWWDQHIRGGHEFSRDIEDAIGKARAVIVAWSAAAVESEWVREEASFAREHDKIVPIRIDDTMPPFGYRQRQAIDMSHDFADEKALAQLNDALAPLVGGEHDAIAGGGDDEQEKAHRAAPRLAYLFLPLLLLMAAAGWWIIAREPADEAAPAAVAEARHSIAVLPFAAQSSGKDDRFFADGISEEILNRLDALDELRVLPRTTSFLYRESEQPIDAIAANLGVDYVVEGALRRSGDNVRVTARLIRAADSEAVWSNSYDGSSDDILQFQSDIAEKIAGALDVLLDDVKLRQMRSVGVDDPQAFALFARALEMNQSAHEDLPDLARLYEASKALDDAFAASPRLWRAAAEGSDLYSHVLVDQAAGIEHPELPLEVRRNAQAEMQKRLAAAKQAAPGRRQGLAIELYAAAFSDDWSRIPAMAREFFGNHDGCNSSNWAGFLIRGYQQVDEIASAYLGMEDCRIGDPLYLGFSSAFLAIAGRIDDARAVLERGRARGLVEEEFIDGAASFVEIHAGNADKALELAVKANSEYNLMWVYAYRGERLDWINRTLDEQSITPWDRLALLAVSGQRERASDFAAAADARPGGPILLQLAVDLCLCGAPFDIERTPNYAARLRQAHLSWPPPAPISWPLKDW